MGISEQTRQLGQPTSFNLQQNNPNPVFYSAIIRYALPQSCRVELKVFNVSGKEIVTLVEQNQGPGYYQVNWNIQNVSKKQLANGVYVYQLKAGGFTETKKMVIVR